MKLEGKLIINKNQPLQHSPSIKVAIQRQDYDQVGAGLQWVDGSVGLPGGKEVGT